MVSTTDLVAQIKAALSLNADNGDNNETVLERLTALRAMMCELQQK